MAKAQKTLQLMAETYDATLQVSFDREVVLGSDERPSSRLKNITGHRSAIESVWRWMRCRVTASIRGLEKQSNVCSTDRTITSQYQHQYQHQYQYQYQYQSHDYSGFPIELAA